ncbi:MAG: PaaI family thioesterase [Alphaproteobacteria bacterium]|nr:PaaI family thioesterase [Alphaproteobacteria bacterium]
MNGGTRRGTSIADGISAARQSGDLQPLVAAVPYFRWLGLRIDRQGEELITIMPFQDMLIGNPMLPALHGGTTGAFLESAAMISLIGAMATPKMPKIINITIEYLRPGRPMDSYATGIVTKLGRRVANVRAYAWQQDREKLIATASTHFMMADASGS